MKNTFITKWRGALLSLSFIGLAMNSSASTVLTDNLTESSSGSDRVSDGTLLAADFSTGGSAYSLDAATLLLQMDTSGSASLNLYSDDSGIPGSLIAALTSPGSYSSSLAGTTFTASNVALAAHTTYWLVLGASRGSFDWSWTDVNTGTGTGFLGDSAYFDGSYWYGTSGVYPYQLSVTADAIGASEVPEPNAVGLLFIGLASLILFAKRGVFYIRRAQEQL